MPSLIEWVRQATGLAPLTQYKLLASLAIVLILWLIRHLLMRVVYRKTEDVRAHYRWRKSSGYITVVIGVVIVGAFWLRAFQSVGTIIGLVSAGLTIALRDLVSGVAGWLFLLWRRPFEVGDRIQIGDDRGDVIDIRVFQFTLMEIGNWVQADQSTGRVIHIPNGRVLSDVVANYSKGFQFIWNEIAVLVTFESNWEGAKEILQQIASKHAEQLSELAEKRVREAAKRFLIFYSKLTPIVYTSVQDCGVLLTVRYLCRPQRRRGTEEGIWEDILHAFAERTDIDFAYPTRRYFDNRLEGKPDLTPDTSAH